MMNWTEEQYTAYLDRQRLKSATPAVIIESEWRDKTENVFQARIIKIATENGWEYYHTHDSRKSPEGWVDLVLARMDENEEKGEVIHAELKRLGEQPTSKQIWWLTVLQLAGLEAYLWDPKDLPFIEKRLRGEQ